MKFLNNVVWACLLMLAMQLICLPSLALAQVNSSSTGQVAKIAPGELLPVSTKLSNFGGNKRVDVTVKYTIISSSDKEISTASETLAVETTANLLKKLQIPFDTLPGTYSAQTAVTYPGQLTPATTQFSFSVERKIMGIFTSDFILCSGISVLFGLLIILLFNIFVRRRRAIRFAPLSYANIPHSQRTFYEILSDTIMQMRTRVGDEALLIAANTEGLKIDKETGRVLALTESPAKIIATLVSEYEKILGRKVSFSLRREKTN